MTAARPGLGFVLLAVATTFVACARPAPPTLPPTLDPSLPSATRVAGGVPLAVRLAGTIHCSSITYNCGAILSVLDAGAVVDDAWRPPASDPRWFPDVSAGYDADHFDPTPVGAVPNMAVGPHRLLISLVGSSDAVSFAPDGTIATDLLSRCSADVDVTPTTDQVSILVTFTPDGQTFGGTCTLEVVP